MLHVAWAGFVAGVQTQLAALVGATRNRSGPTHQICLLEGDGRIGDRVVVEGLGFRLHFRHGWGPGELWRFYRALRRVRPSVISFHSPVLGAAIVAAVLTRADCVFTQHDPALLRRTLRYRIFYWLFRWRFARIVVITPVLRPSVEDYGIDPGRIVVLPNVLTVPLRDASALARTDGQRVIGAAARLEQIKRLDVFIDVIAELRGRGVDCAAIIVGEGSKREELELQARQLHLEGHVQFPGAQKDITPWLDRFDVCLMTSEADIFPSVAIEAMARAVPLVAMPCVGGLPDLAARGGLLLPDREPATAAAALAGLFESRAALDELRARGAEVAAEHTISRVLALHDEFYGALLHPRVGAEQA